MVMTMFVTRYTYDQGYGYVCDNVPMTRTRLEQQLPTSAACRLQVDHSFHILRPPGQVVFYNCGPTGLLGPDALPTCALL